MDEITLRDYQDSLITETRAAMAKYKHVALHLQQGGGKSIIIAFMAAEAAKRGVKVLIVSHRREITSQNSAVLGSLGLDYYPILAKTRAIRQSACYVCMAQTLKSRIEKGNQAYIDIISEAGLILIDEGHLQWSDFIFDHVSPKSWVIGFSGTWSRTGKQKQLGLLYDCIVTGVTAQELIDRNYIVRSRCFYFDAPKLDNVKWDYNKGDWNSRDLSKAFRKRERYAGIVSEYLKICPGMSTIVFTTSEAHCKELCAEFVQRGVRAKYILSKSPYGDDEYCEMTDERKKLLSDFEAGEFNVLVNIDILGTGYNNPKLRAVILDFSTESYSNYAQKAARPDRPDKGTDKTFFYLLDFGDNVRKYGRPENERTPHLWHDEGKGGGIAITKECPGCKRLIHISYSVCPKCGYKFLTQKEIYEVELTELADNLAVPKLGSLKGYVAQKKLDGWKNDWILRDVCIKNNENMKQAFMEAIEILRTENGENISPSYYYFFKKHHLKNVKIT